MYGPILSGKGKVFHSSNILGVRLIVAQWWGMDSRVERFSTFFEII